MGWGYDDVTKSIKIVERSFCALCALEADFLIAVESTVFFFNVDK